MKNLRATSTMSFLKLMLLLFTLAMNTFAQANVFVEINSALMESTYFIFGNSAKNAKQSTIGTGFVLSKPINKKIGTAVLISAAHVLNEIAGDTATVMTRKRLSSGDFVVDPFVLQIRDNGKNKYAVNPDGDVAAMIFPGGQRMTMPAISTDWLINDDRLSQNFAQGWGIISSRSKPWLPRA